MNEVLHLEDISIRFRKTNVAMTVNVSLCSGEYETLPDNLEASVIALVSGEAKLESGFGSVLGYPLAGISSRRQRDILRRVGMISPTEPELAKMRLAEFLSLPLKIAGISEAQVSRRVRSTLSEYGLMLQSNRPLATLATNDRRLAILAQALIKSPALIVGGIRNDEFDQTVVVPALKKYADHGGAVLAFAPNQLRTQDQLMTAEGADRAAV